LNLRKVITSIASAPSCDAPGPNPLRVSYAVTLHPDRTMRARRHRVALPPAKNAIDSIHPTETGMSVSTEILLKISNKGLSVAEVPISVSYEGDTSTQNPVPHGIKVLMNTLKFISVKHPIPFYGFPGIALVIIGSVIGYTFLDAYLNNDVVLLGSLMASIILFLLGAILCVTAVILFSMATLMRERE